MAQYPGGKEGPGTFQRIISLMPPHSVYVEPFAGGGAVLRHKKPAVYTIANDLDPAAVEVLRVWCEEFGRTDVELLNECALRLLDDERLTRLLGPDAVVYLDPPYLLPPAAREYYAVTFDAHQHAVLLDRAKGLGANVLVSGYRTALYDRALADWKRIDYQTMTRGGQVTESLWLNFEPGPVLHDYRYLGNDYRERERIRRRQRRLVKKLQSIPEVEVRALFAALEDAGLL